MKVKKIKRMNKKVSIALFIILIFCFGFKLYRNKYCGDVYYTKIQVIPDKRTEEVSRGNYKCCYDYVKNVYSETKEIKTVYFKEHSDYPLKLGTYLKLEVNKENKVISLKEVDKDDIPQKVLKQMGSEN